MKQVIVNFILLMALTTLLSCSDSNDERTVKTFVLVHGAWQGPYVWDKVSAQLIAKGYKTIVVELPAHGDDESSPATVSIDSYRDKVVDAISAVSGNVILVGHSMGGVVVTAVAEKIPSKIEKLIYIGAFVPANGQSLLDLALTDSQSLLGPSLIPSADQLTLDVVHDNIVSIFCQDAATDVQQLVLSKYRVEPAIPFTNKITTTDVNYGSVLKYYIHTAQDHAIGAELQKSMVAGAKIKNEYSLNTGHSPFLSAPDDVVDTFLQIVK